jgi:hypothetical protein
MIYTRVTKTKGNGFGNNYGDDHGDDHGFGCGYGYGYGYGSIKLNGSGFVQ